ncbi:hypothetical protein O0I10_012942 [Lichtheimia ornata]|uniref:F-box domain-containing protein n=1 Tax=Lichtheimia ornata TaxID=688661 RepID=A0AAD7UQE3_9FUNG|nr:uncharacterized protein O0I10_012942 [Lichtheimia ornata]KAJ8651498.1 hypothetical protein O0I10_012942 [Lichtheimia ornata]
MDTYLKQLVHELHNAGQQGDHEHVIRQSTLALDMVDFQLSMLDIRARSWCACAKVENALEDARHMHQLAPLSPRGYYRQGRIHAQYGYHSKALAIYKKAESLAAAADDDDGLRDEVDNAIKESTQQLKKKIDMIHKLPLDVVLRIAPMVFGEDFDHNHHACLDVSMVWRERLLQYGHLAYGFDAQEPASNVMTSPYDVLWNGHNQIIQLSHYVESLCIKGNKVPFYFLLDCAHFDSLKTLQLQDESLFGEQEIGYATLREINSTLRHLELCLAFQSDDDRDPSVFLERVLGACSNLVSLKTNYVFYHNVHLSTYPTLRRFEFSPPGLSFNTIDYKKLLLAFPCLEHFSVRLIKDSTLLTHIDTTCPYLQSIVVRHQDTLEHLSINLQTDMDPSHLEEMTKHQMQFCRLAHVYFGITKAPGWSRQAVNEGLVKDACEFFGNVLQGSPNIQTLRLSGDALGPSVLHPSLGRLQHIRSFMIGTCFYDYDEGVTTGLPTRSVNALQQVLNEHVDHRTASSFPPRDTLKELKLISHRIHMPLLDSIARLHSLNKLSIHVGDDFLSGRIPFIEDLFKQCPALSDLTIKASIISGSLICALSNDHQLEHLTLHASEQLNDAALLGLATCNRLKTLVVPLSVGNYTVDSLKNAIPGLEINSR